MAKKLKIKLLPNGIIEMETVGVKGKKCMEYAKFMEEIANAKITEQKLTDEYFCYRVGECGHTPIVRNAQSRTQHYRCMRSQL